MLFGFNLSGHGRGWESRVASQPITAVTLGDIPEVSYDLSLDGVFRKYWNLADKPLSNADLSRLALFRPFNTDGGNANIQLRFSNLRRATLRGIDAIGRVEPKAADSLYTMYGNNRLSLAFSDDYRFDSLLRDDGTGFYGDEALNVFSFPRLDTPSAPIELYNPQMLGLINTLLYEGSRTLEPRYSGPFPTTQMTFANWALANQSAEVNVWTKVLKHYEPMDDYFSSISTSLVLPANAKGLGAHIGYSILNDSNLTPTQKQNAATDLLLRLEGVYRPRAEFNLQMRQFYRDGLNYYLDGKLPGPSYNHFMRRTAWYDYDTRRSEGEFRRIYLSAGTAAFTNPTTPVLQTHNYFRQFGVRADGTKQESTITLDELNSIAGAYRWGSSFLAGGDSATTSEGVIWGFRDTNDDGLLEENTGREVLRSSQFYGGFSILKHPVSKNHLVFSRVSNKIFELTGSDVDGFPTGFTDRGTLTTLRNDLLWARISKTGDWAVGYPDCNLPIDKFSLSVEAHYNSDISKFEYYRISYPFTESEVSPALAETPVPNTSYLEATGTPGSWVDAYKVNGTMTLIGNAQVDPNGNVAFQTMSPILGGDTIALKDTMTEEFSPNYIVPNSVVPFFYTPRLNGFGDILFQGFGQPGYRYDVQYGTDPGDLQTGWSYTLPRTGNIFWETMLSEQDTMFVAGVVYEPMTMGRMDHYRVAPGSSQEYHLKNNDRHSSAATFGLTTPSTLDPERLRFAAYGTLTYVALTLGSAFSVDYQIQDNGQVSPPVNVVITPDYQALVNPPVFRLPGSVTDAVQVPCLVIGDKRYPTYQFNCANNPADACGQPHWHSFGPVYSLTDTNGISDPNPGSCGYGRVSEVPTDKVPISLDTWEAFKIAHIPPLSFAEGDVGKISATEEICRPAGAIAGDKRKE